MTKRDKSYLHEDLCYRHVHRDGKPFYQHEATDPCDPDLEYLFSWEGFPAEGTRLLELGCGDGFVTRILAARGLQVTGVDASPQAIQHAQSNLRDAGLSATLFVDDACRLSRLGTLAFPFVLDCHCLHCIPDHHDRSLFLASCVRVLEPRGRVFIATMGEQPMGWTASVEGGPFDKRYEKDPRGCYVESIVPPGMSDRVPSRIFIRREILVEEVERAGLEVLRFEEYAPKHDPGDITYLAELARPIS